MMGRIALLTFLISASMLLASCSNLGNTGASPAGNNTIGNGNNNNLGNSDGSLVQQNMALLFDAAHANGTNFPGSGCTQTNWSDNSNGGHAGTLNNFTACNATSGWNGAGTASDPYRLNFNAGQNNNVKLDPAGGHPLPLGNGPAYTVQAWINTIPNGKLQTILYWGTNQNSNSNQTQGVYVDVNANGNLESDLFGAQGPSSSIVAADGTWHNIAVSYSGGTANVNLYVDGVLSVTAPSGAPSPCYFNNGCQSPHPVGNSAYVGSEFLSVFNFNGAVAHLTVYNSALSGPQISSNCNALAHRFSGAVCH